MVEPRQEKASNFNHKHESNNSKMSNNDSKKSGGNFQKQQSFKGDDNQLRPTAKFIL